MMVATSLYSPAAASDSSGFSERESNVTGFSESTFGPPRGGNTTYALPGAGHSATMIRPTPHYQNFQHMTQNAAAGRAGSPSFFSYHNPTLTASPYSTLPRRLQQPQHQDSANFCQHGAFQPQQQVFRPVFAAGRGSPAPGSVPLVDLASSAASTPLGSFAAARHAAAARASPCSSPASSAVANLPRPTKITARTPLLEDDRESCV